MKHITYAEKSLLVGDDAADTLIDYAAALSRAGSSDKVELNAIGSDGDEVVATFLLDPGVALMAETTTATFEEPDNAEEIARMREQMAALESPRTALPLQKDDFDAQFENDFRSE